MAPNTSSHPSTSPPASSPSESSPSATSPLAALIREFTAPLRTVLGELNPRDIPLPHAVDVLDAFAELRRLGESGAVLMAARAAESGEWARAGCPSPADWMARRHGTSTGRSRADLDTSARLGGLADTSDELRAGNLSAEQAGAVADAASVNPACERPLLDTATSDSLKHTKEEAARRKAEAESEADATERERRVHARRSARWWVKDGRWKLFVEGPLPTGAEAQQALENRIGEIHRTHSAGAREGREQYAYDAAMDLLTSESATTAQPAGDGATPHRSERTASVNRLMLIRVDLSALINGEVGDGEVCEIPGVGPISATEARRLYGDSVIRLITTDRNAVVDVVTPSRRPTVAQQIAKLWTDPKCVVAGCNRTVRLEYEHRDDFARSRRTVLVDLEHMCKHDHDLKTYENWQLVAGSGRRALVPPGHPLHPDSLPRSSGGPTPPDDSTPAQAPDVRTTASKAPSAVTDLTERVARLRGRAERRGASQRGQQDLFGDTG